MQKIKIFFLFLLLISSLPSPALSEEKAITSPETWSKSFENYLFNLGSVTGKFSQIDQIGRITKGSFWSDGKGSIKFNYDPPSALLIVIKDGIFLIREGSDDSISRYSIKENPLSKLFSKEFSLKSFVVNEIEIKGGIGTMELRTKKDSVRNSITLTGDYPKPLLRQWKLIDSQNKETLVFFSKIRKFDFLDESFFNID